MRCWLLRFLVGIAGILGPALGEGVSPVPPAAASVPIYRESRQFATAMKQVRFIGVATNDQVLLVGDRSIVRMDSRGARLSSFPASIRTRCLAYGPDGAFFLGVGDHVEVLTPDGKPADRWPPFRSNSWITAMAVSGSDIFVADAGSRMVLRCSLQGKVLGRIGGRDPARPTAGFVVPSPYFDLVLDKQGILHVTNPGRHRVETYSREGELLGAWGQMAPAPGGFYGCCNPSFLALLADGRFVTSSKGYREVNLYDATGQFLATIAGTTALGGWQAGLAGNARIGPTLSGTGDPCPVAVDSRGRILILDPDRKTIRVFELAAQAAAAGCADRTCPPSAPGARSAIP